MSRKSLNDFLSNDRAVVRRAHQDSASTSGWSGRNAYSALPTYNKGSSSILERCYKSHKPMKLPKSKAVIYGGSCSEPIIDDADIYIGFDRSMVQTSRSYPWNKGHEILFRIPDMGVPSNPEEFRKLVLWVKKQLDSGRKVHAGCIGGHGRTGTFFAALVTLYGEKNAINYVRTHYCLKAVESTEQVAFLKLHYDVIEAPPTKTYSSQKTTSKTKTYVEYDDEYKGLQKGNRVFHPLTGERGIWEIE